MSLKQRIKLKQNIYVPHKEVYLCCFLTVSCPIYAILTMFHRLGFSPTKKATENSAEEKGCYKSLLEDRPEIFLP